MSKKMGRLLDPSTGKMECKICGRNWLANLRGGGKYYRGSWQCPWGCKFETKDNTAAPVEAESPQSSS